MKILNVIYIYSKYGQVNGTKQTPIEDSETSYDHILTLFNRMNSNAQSLGIGRHVRLST
jgi:hypothetical protein